MARRITPQRVQVLLWLAWLLNLSLPFSLRYSASWAYGVASPPAMAALLFALCVGLSSLFSILLPVLIQQQGGSSEALARGYAAELGGAVLACAFMVLSHGEPWALAVAYQLVLAVLMALLSTVLRWVPFVALAMYLALFVDLEQHSLDYRYAGVHGFQGHQVLSSVNSAYQKVDVIRNRNGGRHIFLNGREHYGSSDLARFSRFMCEVPGGLVRPRRAVVIGSGSMTSARLLSQFAEHVTTVELDGAVVDASRRFLSDINRVSDSPAWTLVIDDAKPFLAKTQERYDLIVMDVPAPLGIREALLHTVETYRLARAALTDQGVLSVSLSWDLPDDSELPQAVAAALRSVFENVMVYSPKHHGRSYALAGRALPFTVEHLRTTATEIGHREVHVYQGQELDDRIGPTPPLTVDDMSLPIRQSWREVSARYLGADW
jgi:spermidine synthase